MHQFLHEDKNTLIIQHRFESMKMLEALPLLALLASLTRRLPSFLLFILGI
jgi:hypothetical protein